MNIVGHAASAVPFLLTHNYIAAGACVAPDLTWVPHEWAFRRSGMRDWHAWSATPDALRPRIVRAYRTVHSVPVLLCVCVVVAIVAPHVGAQIAMGWGVHIALDLPTHKGVMAQRPLYPISQWRWPWTWV